MTQFECDRGHLIKGLFSQQVGFSAWLCPSALQSRQDTSSPVTENHTLGILLATWSKAKPTGGRTAGPSSPRTAFGLQPRRVASCAGGGLGLRGPGQGLLSTERTAPGPRTSCAGPCMQLPSRGNLKLRMITTFWVKRRPCPPGAARGTCLQMAQPAAGSPLPAPARSPPLPEAAADSGW